MTLSTDRIEQIRALVAMFGAGFCTDRCRVVAPGKGCPCADIAAALAALAERAPAIPEGYVLVPREPTR
jgi:hypothetical protein